ncbi:MAG: methyltransferase domain-containing protein [Propionibacteriaceae bacterium]|jgi:ubiquinone/menaquinone biosynthesis C-methylase UbiE|nr:methyltransferase domain-containing protein [Propionibacteriaceae bacterium]
MVRYIHGHSDAVLRAHRTRTAANSADHLLPYLKPGQSLLDVGCGEGWITRDLARLVHPGRVVGVDASEEAIAQAEAGGDIPDNLSFAVADLFELPFPDASFDVAHIHQVLHHVADPVGGLRSVARVTRPGGIISDREADFGACFWHPPSPGWELWQRAFIKIAAAEGEDMTIARQLRQVAEQAGFTDTTSSAAIWSYPGFQTLEDATSTWAERLTAPHFVELAEAAGVATEAQLAEAVADIQRWATDPAAFFAQPHCSIIVHVP